MSRSGADLALLLLAGFRRLADDATERLAERGHPGVRPAHDFALRAVEAGARSVSEVGRAVAVSKQAAAKTVAFLEDAGYLARSADPQDGRRARLEVTARGRALMTDGEAVFDELRAEWEALVGRDRVADLDDALRRLTARTGAPPEPAAGGAVRPPSAGTAR